MASHLSGPQGSEQENKGEGPEQQLMITTTHVMLEKPICGHHFNTHGFKTFSFLNSSDDSKYCFGKPLKDHPGPL